MANLFEAVEANKTRKVRSPEGFGALYAVGELVKIVNSRRLSPCHDLIFGEWTIIEPKVIYAAECRHNGTSWYCGYSTLEELEKNRQLGYEKGHKKFIEVEE